jgi:hypothetical protein
LIEPRLEPPSGPRPLWLRLGWLLLIWGASTAALGLVAMLIRFWLGA